MNGHNAAKGSRRARTVKVAPIAHAVRLALATSATALALVGSGSAFAQSCTPVDGSNTTTCSGSFTDTVNNAPSFPMPAPADLTVVLGDGVVPTSVIPATQGAAGVEAAWAGSAAVISSADISTDSGDGIHAAGADSVSIDNSGSITTYDSLGGAMALDISALGDVDIVNSGALDSVSEYYDVTTVRAVSTGVGDVSIDNQASGSITADSHYGSATAVFAAANGGDTMIDNAGSIGADSKYGNAIGVYAYSYDGHAGVSNDGTIQTSSEYGLADGIFASGVTTGVANNGDIEARGYGWASAIETYAVDAATVTNNGLLDAYATDDYGQAFGVYARSGSYGAVTVVNDAAGSIDAESSKYYGHSAGILANGGIGGVSVDNAGGIVAYGAYVNGIEAVSIGGIDIGNSGSISAEAPEGFTTGILATSAIGDITVDNSGAIELDGYYGATGIDVFASGYGANAGVSNSGSIYALESNSGDYSTAAIGILVFADTEASVDNAGSITAISDAKYGSATGVTVSAFAGDATVSNSGDISAQVVEDSSASPTGVAAFSRYGDAYVDNSGTVSVDGGFDATGVTARTIVGDVSVDNSGVISGYGKYATGVSGLAYAGDVSIDHSGTIDVTATLGTAVGVFGRALTGDVNVTSTGDIQTHGVGSFADAIGIFADAYDATTVANSGDITATSYGILAGGRTVDISNSGEMQVVSDSGFGGRAHGVEVIGVDEITIVNSGDIHASFLDATTFARASGLYGRSYYDGDVSIGNSADIVAQASGDRSWAYATHASSDGGDIAIDNSGSQTASSNGIQSDRGSIGLYGYSDGGNVSINNSGYVGATSAHTFANGILASGRSAYVDNSGSIEASSSGGDAFGINGIASGGDLFLANTGSIGAASVDGDAVGIQATITDADVTVTNAGSITAVSDNGAAYAIRIVDGDVLLPGNATITNSGSLTGAIATGAGNDTFINHGIWDLVGPASDFGAGNDSLVNALDGTLILADSTSSFGAGSNTFSNAGTIKVAGDSFIDMTDGSAAALAAALERPKHTAPFINNGTIDMLDGAADDSLTITGGFGGNGYLNLDVSLDNQLNDKLFVAGGVLNGSKQFVNIVLLDGLPGSDDLGKKLELVHVSGDTNPSIFKAGQVLGVSPRDFMSLGLKLSGTPIDGSIGGSYNLTVKTLVNGLNAAGVLASSVALGVDSLVTSTTGSRSDRTYLLSAGGNTPAFATIVPWVRGFSDEAGMSPDHLAGNFGQMSASRLSQDNFGTEMGFELRARNGFRFGVLFAKSEGRQYLVDERGMDTIRGSTLGLYGTWVSPRGFYVEASWRTMQFEANIDSIGGRQRTYGNAVNSNVEAGYSWTLGNGLNVEPQLRYTTTTVDGLRIHGDQATFESQDAQWKRGRAGVSLWKTYGGASGWRWTPRAELGIVHTFEGTASYSINDDYYGNVMTEGTSAMVKFALGAQKGRLSWSGGVNWMDGETFDSALGGQMTLRYSW